MVERLAVVVILVVVPTLNQSTNKSANPIEEQIP